MKYVFVFVLLQKGLGGSVLKCSFVSYTVSAY